MKVTSPSIIKNIVDNYFINNDLDHKEIEIIVDALNDKIHKGIPEKDKYDATVKLYGEMFALWEATVANEQVPVPVGMVKENRIEPQSCPENSTWNDKSQKCMPNAGFYQDENGEMKPVPTDNCGANAHFDEKLGCVCDDGFERNEKTGLCVPKPVEHVCPKGQHWDEQQQLCVDDVSNPPK